LTIGGPFASIISLSPSIPTKNKTHSSLLFHPSSLPILFTLPSHASKIVNIFHARSINTNKTCIKKATTLGAFMSLCAMLVMTILFLSETFAFLHTIMATTIALDENDQPQIRLNFNITLLDLHCDYVSVDVWDTLGTNRQNVTKNIEKWQLDEYGTRRIFSGRNRDVREVINEEHYETLEELHADGEQAVELTNENFSPFVHGHEMTFIDFYAP